MKPITLTILYILTSIVFCHSQCTFENMIPLNFGTSKFSAITEIASLKNLKQKKHENQQYEDFMNSFRQRWEKYHYLKGDSVYMVWLEYEYIYNDCFKGENNELLLYFADDKLYEMRFILSFSSDNLEKCIENYNNLITIFKINFSTFSKFSYLDNVTSEQTGEGYKFYPTLNDKRDYGKINRLKISYNMVKDTKYSQSRYTIEIEYCNFKGTRLINEGN
jgi:hypothetical protein